MCGENTDNIKIRSWKEYEHPLDVVGREQIESVLGNHTMKIISWGCKCGVEGETVRCSCGKISVSHNNGGCEQNGHNVSVQHNLDGIHKKLYNESKKWQFENNIVLK